MTRIALLVGLVTAFVLGVSVGTHLEADLSPLLEQALVPGLVTLAAAFFGAKYAFDLQAAKALRETESAQIAAGNKAIFALVRKYNQLLNFKHQFLERFRDDPTAFLQMPPLLELMKDDILVDFDSLSYLLETDQRNLLGELSVGVEKHQSAIGAINARSRLHITEAQPALEKAEIVEGGKYTFQQMETALGQRLHTTLRQATDQVFEHTTGTLLFLENVTRKLTAALREQFPGRSIIAMGKDVAADEHNNRLQSDGPTPPGRA